MRIWKSSSEDDGSVHVLGNGKLCVYEQGPNIIQMFGRPYSSPTFLSLTLDGENMEVHSERTHGTAIWLHTIYRDSVLIGVMIDFVDSELPCMVRKVNVTESISFNIKFHKNALKYDNSSYFNLPSIYARLDRGEKIYSSYPSTERSYHQMNCTGDSKCDFEKIICAPGVSEIYFSGAPTYAECIGTAEKALRSGFEPLISQTHSWWLEFTGRRKDFESTISEDIPARNELLEAADSVSVLIKAQQSDEGGVLAGYNYHLAYVRDMYGVFRSLLYLGYIDEAKKIIQFYYDIWKKQKVIHNAQGMGADGLFHIHENDNSEITGYLILQSFDYLNETGDLEFIDHIFPMLVWAFESQSGELKNGMMPFNGDETYVAGGILPRSSLQEGSAEATMLFIKSGEMLIQRAENNSKWIETVGIAKRAFKANFMDGMTLMANNPDRLQEDMYARFRYGICEVCSAHEWLERNEGFRYLCPKCFNEKIIGKAERKRYNIRSVSLFPQYIGSDLIAEDELKFMIDGIVEQYHKTGNLPSRPDGDRTVGYDYGFLLNALTILNHEAADEIYRLTLSVLDRSGAWVEYYTGGKPQSTRCRPWESGINIEACLRYAVSCSEA